MEERAGTWEKGVHGSTTFSLNRIFLIGVNGDTYWTGAKKATALVIWAKLPCPYLEVQFLGKCPLGEVEVLINFPRQTCGISSDLQALHL